MRTQRSSIPLIVVLPELSYQTSICESEDLLPFSEGRQRQLAKGETRRVRRKEKKSARSLAIWFGTVPPKLSRHSTSCFHGGTAVAVYFLLGIFRAITKPTIWLYGHLGRLLLFLFAALSSLSLPRDLLYCVVPACDAYFPVPSLSASLAQRRAICVNSSAQYISTHKSVIPRL